ncbi:MAG: ATPase [Rhodospirillaceae bacterium]|nr:ATPase [Rhodospirillaceae bacterium]
MAVMKRFYEEVGIIAFGNGFGVVLDDHPVKTPAKSDLVVPTRSLAYLICDEWQAQGVIINAESMPTMQLATTAIDQTPKNRELVVENLVSYASTDLLCYRAEEPAALKERQHQVWQPILDWVESNFDAPLVVTSGIMPMEQPQSSMGIFNKILSQRDDFFLTGLSVVTASCGSLALALALAEDEVDVESCIAASQLDEIFQIEQWGEDEDVTARLAGLAHEIRNAARFLGLIDP